MTDPELAEAKREIERLNREGVPGVMHEADRAFYNLTVKQRDAAWREIERLRAEALRCIAIAEDTHIGANQACGRIAVILDKALDRTKPEQP